MKVLIINGSPRQKGNTSIALEEIAKTLREEGIDSETVWIGNKPVRGCIACNQCAKKPGACIFNDDICNEISAKYADADALIVGSPVYYGGPSGRLCSFLDRLFFSSDAEKFRGKLAASVVSCRRGGATASCERLNQFFLMNNMHAIGSQYWNQVHGFTAEDVRRDAEGLQTMRTLGQNMAYLLKAQEAADAAGLPRPVYEPPVFTSFMD